jgi:hypothetical protein
VTDSSRFVALLLHMHGEGRPEHRFADRFGVELSMRRPQRMVGNGIDLPPFDGTAPKEIIW